MKFTVFGSGTSHGVPMIGCNCAVCQSDNPLNHRNRSCFVVTSDEGKNIVVDTPPEFRLMAIKFGLMNVDHVLYTHSHADHIFGMDDLRIFNWRRQEPIPLYAEQIVLDDIQRAFSYCFQETQKGGGKPQLDLHAISPGQLLTLDGIDIRPLRVMHGRVPILAYKFGQKVAFVTDVSLIPEETWEQLYGLDYLFLDAVRREPHSTHFHLDKAVEVVAALKPKQAYFIHLSHDYDHEATNAELPDGVDLAYDGLQVTI